MTLLAWQKNTLHIDHYELAIKQWRLIAKWHHRYGEADKADKVQILADFIKEQLNNDNPPYPLPLEQGRKRKFSIQ